MRLALGTVQFGIPYGVSNDIGQVSDKSAKDILKYASSAGIDTIDTAIDYGQSEEVLGQVGVDNFKVISKLPYIHNEVISVEDWISNQINSSLNRLGLKSLYGFMLHHPNQIFSSFGEEVLESLQKLKQAGLVQKLGVSIYDPAELENIYNQFHFDIVQCPFNILDRRLVQSGWLEKLNMKGVEIHTRSCFLQGLLLMKRDQIPKKFDIWKNYWDKWEEWSKDNNTSKLNGCLSYCLSFKGIHKVVVGVEKKLQLKEVVHASNSKFLNKIPDLGCSDLKLINPVNW